MDGLPPINSLLFVAVNGETSYRSRVEDVDDGDDVLTVAAPIGAGDLDIPEMGSEVAVFWVGSRTRYVMPVRMVGVTRQQPARWQVRPTAEPRPHTRRRYVRGGGGKPAQMAAAEPAASASNGVVEDISEGGVRCRMPAGEFEPGQEVKVRIALDGEAVDVIGTVHTVRPDPINGEPQVVVTYQLSEATAQTIRRYVFAWELAERRRARYGDG